MPTLKKQDCWTNSSNVGYWHPMSPVNKLANFLETMKEESLHEIDSLYAEKLDFKDPINTASDREHLKSIERDLFKQLNEVTFVVSSKQEGESEGFVSWVMRYKFRLWKREITGVSHIKWNAEGKITYQHDYWDASFGVYGEFPPLGFLMKLIKKMVSVKA